MDSRQAEPWSQPDPTGRSGLERPYDQVPGTFPSGIVYHQFNKPVSCMELEGSTLAELDAKTRPIQDLVPKPSEKPTSKRTVSSPRVEQTIKPSNAIVIAVFGLTGTGKSSFISKLSGRDVKRGEGFNSCKQPYEVYSCFMS